MAERPPSAALLKEPYIEEIGVPRLTLLRKLGDGLELGLIGVFEQQGLASVSGP